ncbi:MAG: nitronate monooxygenase [Thermodesulfobacteriota bacterium]|nr:nitronate monooxygenase [Thermodesulfobacteriota bacterium]
MIKTRITELFGIEYPIIQGGMARASNPELVAAVSNAGGLGILVSATCETKEGLRKEIKQTRSLTNKPFGVNLSLFPSVRPIPNDDYVEVIVDEGIAMVETSGFQAPEAFMDRLKAGNVKVMHKCAAARHAVKAEKIGVDAVAVVGFENGGAMGMDDVTTFVIVPITVDSVKIPVLAGGGIADGKGFTAALALGAEGVVVGTRFMATHECCLHPNFKNWMVKCSERDTIPVMRSLRNTHRALRNKIAEEVAELERKDAPTEEILKLVGGEGGGKVMHEGKLEEGIGMSGQVVGNIHNVVSAKEVIDEMVKGAKKFQERLNSALS